MSDQAAGLRQLIGGVTLRPALRVLAVTSGKGGVGKTSIAANLALHAAALGRRVLILDADLGLANVEILYGLSPRWHLGHVLAGQVSLEEALIEGPRGVRVLASGSGVQESSRFGDEERLGLLAALDAVEDRFDLLIVDSPAGIHDNVLFFVGAAQEALLVVSPEPTSLSDAYAAVKSLSQRAGLQHFHVVVNFVASDEAARRVFDKLAQVTARFLTARLDYLGHIPRDENLSRAVLLQRPALEAFPRAPFSRALGAVGDALWRKNPPPPHSGGLKFLWQRLLREADSARSP